MSEFINQSKKSIASDEKEQLNSGGQKASSFVDNRPQTVQCKTNNTGLPDNLKSGIENLSGHSMDDVKVHYNSDKPAQLNAHAYAQGTNIHVASGQEKHLAHEAWHVVQQKQGRVQPTLQMKGKINVNNDIALEKEADVMGAKAMTATHTPEKMLQQKAVQQNSIVQGKWAGLELETLIPIYRDGEREDHIDGYVSQPGYEHTDVVPGISKELGDGFQIHVDSSDFSKNNGLATCGKDGKPKIMEIVTPPRSSPDENVKDLAITKAFLSTFTKYTSVNGNGWNIGWPKAKAGFTPPGKSEVPAQVLNENFALDAKQTNPFEYYSQITYQNDIETLGKLEDNYTKASIYDETGLNEKVNALKPHLAGIIQKSASKTLPADAMKLAIIAAKTLSDTLYFLEGVSPGTIKNAVATLIRSDLRSMHIYLNTQGGDHAAICKSIVQQFAELAGNVLPKDLETGERSAAILTNKQHGESSNVNAAIKDQVIPKGGRYVQKTVASVQVLSWWSTEMLRMLMGPDDKAPAVTGPLKGDRELAELQRDDLKNPMVVYEVRGSWSGDLDKGFDKSVSEMMKMHELHNFKAPEKGRILLPLRVEQSIEQSSEDKKGLKIDTKDSKVPEKEKEVHGVVGAAAASSEKSPAQNLAALKTALGTAVKGTVFKESWQTMIHYFEEAGGSQAHYLELIYKDKCKTVIQEKSVEIAMVNADTPQEGVTIKVE